MTTSLQSISTARMRLACLTMDQLKDAVVNPSFLAGQLGCRLAPESISDASQRAIAIKIEKMKYVPANQHGWISYWMLILKEELIGIGLAGFKGAPNSGGEVEIGYGIATEYQNRGFMTEAVGGLVTWAVQQPGCRYVTAETLKNNPASQQVLVKNGFAITRESETALFWRSRSNSPSE
ncbi:MAG: GNAT family N-acetyltransferase [Anaerolineaceae bacterium]|nr:GNAT family N-acetyltransferase [Anaerolineaceae bacterium]